MGVAEGGLRGEVVVGENRPYRLHAHRDHHDRETQEDVHAY